MTWCHEMRGTLVLAMLAFAGVAAADVLPEPPIHPWVHSISPSIGRPTGGQAIYLTGSNFEAPIRIFFEVGAAQPLEAFVIASTPTQIQVLTPSVILPADAQQLEARVVLFTRSGTVYENRTDAGSFTFRNEILSPRILLAAPSTSPMIGGTRVSIFGDGFQSPVQVLFGDAEARVVDVRFNEIIVESPPHEVGIVSIRVHNIVSSTSFTLPNAIRYRPNIDIHGAGPLAGPDTGGTRVTVWGVGFNAPAAVMIGEALATLVRITGTELLAITPAITTSACQSVTAPLRVVDILTGEQAEGPSFTYIPHKPVIVGLRPLIARPDDSLRVTLDGIVQEPISFFVHGTPVTPSAVLPGADTTTYVLPIPRIALVPGPCETPAKPVSVDVRVVLTNGCEDLLSHAILVFSGADRCRPGPPKGH
jgi:hypothetical protein